MAKIHIRQSQTAYTYAAGSIGDFPGISVMFLSHDHHDDDWGKPKDQLRDDDSVNKRRVIIDKRLTDAFGINNFVLPPIIGIGNLHLKVIRFPMSMYCPKCGRIYFASELEKVNLGYIPKINPPKTFDELLRAYYCLDCQEENKVGKKKGKKNRTQNIELIPTRFIIANEEGFIDDFPWDWYVHRKPEKRKEQKKGHKLYLEFGSSSASLGSISIISKDRNGNLVSRENLGDIFNQEATFIAGGDEYLKYVKNYMPKPWLGRDKDGFLLKLIDGISTEQIQRDNEGEITGKNIEVMVYGDGAFKDPVGKIWELADPVVSPFYTKGLEGTPNELKLKYLADNKYNSLNGEKLNKALTEEIKNKNKNLVGKNVSLGTTPRRYTDLLGSLADLTSGSGDKGTPVVLIQHYFDNYSD